MDCPSCHKDIEDSGAWLCPHCEHIIDASFLGDDFASVDVPARPEITRIVAWSPPPGTEEEVPDALILGDDVPSDEGVSVMSGARSSEGGRTSAFLFYTSTSTSRSLRPDAIPVMVGSVGRGPRTPYEDFVLSCIDGQRNVATIHRLSGLAAQEVSVTLLTLLDKRVIALRVPKSEHEDRDLEESEEDQDRDADLSRGRNRIQKDASSASERPKAARRSEVEDDQEPRPTPEGAHEPRQVSRRRKVWPEPGEPAPADRDQFQGRLLEAPDLSIAPPRGLAEEPDRVDEDADSGAMVVPQPLTEDDGEMITDAAARPKVALKHSASSVVPLPLDAIVAPPDAEAKRPGDGRQATRGPKRPDSDLDDLDELSELEFADEPPRKQSQDRRYDESQSPSLSPSRSHSPLPLPLDPSFLVEVPPSTVGPSPVQITVRGVSGSRSEGAPQPVSAARIAPTVRRTAAQERVRAPIQEPTAQDQGPQAQRPEDPSRPPESASSAPMTRGMSAAGTAVEARRTDSEPVDNVRMLKGQKLFEQALKDRAEGNFISARMNMKLAITFDPGNQSYQRAFDEISKNPEAMPKSGSSARSRAKEFYDKATEAESAGDVDKAIEHLEAAINESRQAAFLNRLGVILAMKKREYSRAQSLIEEAIEMSPGNETYGRNLHKILSSAATASTRDLAPSEGAGIKKGLIGLLGKLK